MLRLLNSIVEATYSASCMPMTIEKVAQIAVDLTGVTDTWQADEIMDNIHKGDQFIKWTMGLNLHNCKIIKNRHSNYETFDMGGEKNIDQLNDQYEVDSSSEEDEQQIDSEIECIYMQIMHQKKVKRAIPSYFLIKPPKMSDETYLYDLIAEMTREMFAEFFQHCYDIVHNCNFALILFDTIIMKSGNDPLKYYDLLDQYHLNEKQMIDAIKPSSAAKAIKNLLNWVREEDLLKKHTEIGAKANVLWLTIRHCNAKDIQRIFDQLAYKLGKSIPIPNLRMINVDFSRQESPFSCILHMAMPYLTGVKFEGCLFKNGVLNLISSRSNVQTLISTTGKYKLLAKIKQLRINRCKLSGIDDSLGLLKELRLLSIRKFEFEQVPESIYCLKQLRILRLRGGNLYDIPDDIKKLTRLEILAISQNKFESIPIPVTEMENLMMLVITNNRITKISNSMENMKRLSVLILENNEINPDACCKDLRLSELRILSLKNCMLDKLPEFIKPLIGLKTLVCSRNRITELDVELHTHLKGLEKLILSHNNFKTIPATIENMISLKTLIIGCDIPEVTLDAESFSPPAGLTRLGLQNSRFKNGIPEWIFGLKQLTELNIMSSDIRIVPSRIAELKNLTKLKLVGCNLLKFPEELTNLLELKFLHLGQNPGIKTISPHISKFKKLEILIMYECGLTGELCKELCHLKLLEQLIISNNFITKLPTEIGNLNMVRNFDLSCNHHLQSLPTTIGSMHSLVILKATSCNLENIPDTIGDLKLLEKIDIGMNKRITMLPESIGHLSRLFKARFNGMSLSIPIQWCHNTFGCIGNQVQRKNSIPNTFFNLYNLRELDFAYNNKLHTIPELITKLRYVEMINICKCGLKEIPDAIYKLPQLRELRAGINGISKLSENIGNLKHLRVLMLFVNNLDSLPSSLSELHELEVLVLNMNRFPPSYQNDMVRLGRDLQMYSLKKYDWSTKTSK